MTKKDFFQAPSVSDILKRDSIVNVDSDLINKILETGDDGACIIQAEFLPKKFRDPKRFMKYGPKVGFSDFLANEGFGWNGPKGGYVEWCEEKGEKFLRTFSLYQNLEGSKIVRHCYNELDIDCGAGLIYSTNKDGVDFLNVNIPSREKGKSDHEIKFECVPRGLGYDDLRSRHECGSKKHGMGHGVHSKTKLRVDAFCAHDYAAYVLLRNHYFKNGKDFNWTEGSLLVVPSKGIINFYDKLNSNCLMCSDGEDKPRKLNVAEKEISLFGYVGKFGFEDSFSLMNSKR